MVVINYKLLHQLDLGHLIDKNWNSWMLSKWLNDLSVRTKTLLSKLTAPAIRERKAQQSDDPTSKQFGTAGRKNQAQGGAFATNGWTFLHFEPCKTTLVEPKNNKQGARSEHRSSLSSLINHCKPEGANPVIHVNICFIVLCHYRATAAAVNRHSVTGCQVNTRSWHSVQSVKCFGWLGLC